MVMLAMRLTFWGLVRASPHGVKRGGRSRFNLNLEPAAQ